LNEAHAVIAGSLVGFLPSPSTNVLHLVPLTLHMYGLMLLAGIAAALWLTRRRWTQMGGDGDLVYRVGLWGVAAGIVGARLYHVVTSWSLVPDPKWEGVFEVWNGGLGIWGGVLFGCAAGALVVRRAGASVRWMLDAAAPLGCCSRRGGRWGNWWNQELFGKPTRLPWALEISPAHRPVGCQNSVRATRSQRFTGRTSVLGPIGASFGSQPLAAHVEPGELNLESRVQKCPVWFRFTKPTRGRASFLRPWGFAEVRSVSST
jgi:prolipoprotein diacylglyceryltransferase